MSEQIPSGATSTQESVISASSLNLTFQTNDGPVHALKDVGLDISQGDFVSFIGPSGCGKTTFLRCIAGLEVPTSGTLTVNGMSPDEARRARAYGYVFQAAGLYPWRTIGGNIRLPLEIMGFSKAEQADITPDRAPGIKPSSLKDIAIGARAPRLVWAHTVDGERSTG
ncbi:MAG: ATP-binding cassette domain-containing protein, partial [Pseudomonadota bacterium]